MGFNKYVPDARLANGLRLGRRPARSDVRALMFANYVDPSLAPPPRSFKPWARRARFANRSFGNTAHGNCTIAKQAVAALRMERREQRRTIDVFDQEVVDVYYRMTDRLYGGGDVGAYEVDALNNWRRADLTFRDVKGRPLTIDAYTRLNHLNHDELRQAIYLSGAQGVAVCFNLPWAWASNLAPEGVWAGHAGPMVGPWEPGTWGGHSMWATGYDAKYLYVEHTWDLPTQAVEWAGCAQYLDEAHLVIDSVNAWKKKLLTRDLVGDLNAVSDLKVKHP